MSPVFRNIYRFTGALFAILTILGVFGVWKLSTKDMSSDRWTPYIAFMFERIVPQSRAEIGASVVAWNSRKLTLSILCDDITLYNMQGSKMMAFPQASLRVRLLSLLRGRILPEAFAADSARFWLVRHDDNVLRLGGGALQDAEKTVTQESQREWAAVLRLVKNITDDLARDTLRHDFNIKNMNVALYDSQTSKNWELTVPEFRLVHNRDEVLGQARVLLQEGDEASALQLTYTHDFDAGQHVVVLAFQDIRLASFSLFSPDFDIFHDVALPVSGHVSLRADKNLLLAAMESKLEVASGTVHAPALWEKPVHLSKATVAAQYDRREGVAEITEAVIDLGGPKLSATLQANVWTEPQHFWFRSKRDSDKFTLQVKMTDLPMDSFENVWPIPAMTNARAWIASQLTGGIFTSGEVTVHGRGRFDDIKNVSLDSATGEITAQKGRVVYLEGMPAIEGVDAHATFDLARMDIEIKKGNTGEIRLEPFTIHITDFQKDTQNIEIPVKLRGSVPDILRLIDHPPLGYAKQVGLVPAETKGMAAGTLTLTFPLLSDLLMDDVRVQAKAKITGFGSDTLVPQILLSEGALDMDLTADGLALSGGISLNNVPSQIKWWTLFDETKAIEEGKPIHKAAVEAQPIDEQWAAFYGLGEHVRINGRAPLSVTYENIKTGESKVSVQAVLDAVEVLVPELAWVKSPQQSAKVSADIYINEGQDIRVRTIVAQGAGLNISGEADLSEEEGRLIRGQFEPFIIGRSHAALAFTRPVDSAQPFVLSITGKSFDASGLLSSTPVPAGSLAAEGALLQPPIDTQQRDFALNVDRFYSSTDGFMDQFVSRTKRGASGWEEIDLSGLAQGQALTRVMLTPQPQGGRALQGSSEDFGITLQGLGFGDVVRNGRLDFQGISTPETPHIVDGELKISSFVVKDWPVLARLFNALSPFGFADLITGDATFNYLKGDFRLDNAILDLKDVRAAGSVVGLNLDGRIDFDAEKATLHGTAVPFSFVNSIIGSIPLLGDVITGGKGQGVIAATFSVRGPLSDLEVSVNPVSLLTPGFLRNLFFPGDDGQTRRQEEKAAS